MMSSRGRRRLVAVLAALLATGSLLPLQVAAAQSHSVLVYGGTPAGVMAAVAARRNGAASVLLLEPTAHLGGMVASGLNATDWGDKKTIGGVTREFFSRMEAIEGTPAGRYSFQSRNAEQVYTDMLVEAGVGVRMSAPLAEGAAAVVKNGHRIASVRTVSGEVFSATQFIDATYEGDLMARAGVSYVIGREAASQYGEELAGVRPTRTVVNGVGGLDLGFPLVPAPGPLGSADGRIQDSNFRLCFTTVAANQVDFREPPGYDPATYAVVAAHVAARIAAGQTPQLSWLLSLAPTVNGKYDVNDASGISIALPGANYGYPDGSYATRAAITELHRSYTEGFLYFLRNDPSIPAVLRNAMAAYGLCRDEFTDNDHWPYLLYLREGRRMRGVGFLTEHDIQDVRSKPDIVAIASYRVDSHYVSRWIDGSGSLKVEGSFGSPSMRVNYAVPYRILTPKRAEASNLLVPVTISASHVAQSSLRMEPQYMMMGEAAGAAAVLAGAGAVQDVHAPTLQSRLLAAGAVLSDPGDIGTSQFYGDIVWAYFAGIISHCTPGKFCPTAAVTREMMADFLVRALDLPPASRDWFTDDAASPFEDSINRLAEAGITKGCTTTTFCPLATVTRDQMASFLVRAYKLPLSGVDLFTDDDESIHEKDINRLAAAGVTAGCGAGLFCPKRTVTRGEMMAFIHRASD